jgi:type IV protein arginine methyltransferase
VETLFGRLSTTSAAYGPLSFSLRRAFADSAPPAQTAGDIAFSLNQAAVYDFLLGEGVRAEMLRAAMEAATAASEAEDEEEVDEDGDLKPKLSTASDNATFLASKLRFTKDSAGQEIAVDEEGNGVMMGWEREIMRVSAERMCEPFEARRKGVKDPEEELNVVNVGFGLGIVSRLLLAAFRSSRFSSHSTPCTQAQR